MRMMRLAMLVIIIPIVIYLYRFMRRSCQTFGVDSKKKGVKAVLWLIAVCLGALCSNVFGFEGICILHLVTVALLVQLLNFLIKRIAGQTYKEGFQVWKKIYGSGIIPLLISAGLIGYGYYNMHHVVETDYVVYTDKEIREEGYRVALIADVHFGISLDYEQLLAKCEEISEKDADIVVLCGDIVDDSATKESMESVFQALGTIKNKYGIFYVYGNHDRQLYRTDRAYTQEELADAIERNGITILQDEVFEVNEEFIIAGREDRGYGSRSGRLPVDTLLSEADPDAFILTLDHQPKEYAENGQAGTDLLLSGHTHGGQIWPVNYLISWMKVDDAQYGHTWIDEDTQAIVTAGFAGWGFPVKTAAPSEYVIIDIEK